MAQVATEDDLYNLIDQRLSQLDFFSTGGSGWIVEKLFKFDIKASKTPRLGGSSYIPTPPVLCARISRHCLLNIRDLYENYCFLYSVAAALFPPEKIGSNPGTKLTIPVIQLRPGRNANETRENTKF